MEQILNKLSEIELTAKRIMEDADSTKSALSAEMEEKCKEFDAAELLYRRAAYRKQRKAYF